MCLIPGQVSVGLEFRPLPDAKDTLYSIEAVRALSIEAAQEGHPVEITGVVTYYHAAWSVLFVQNGDAGIYVDPHSLPPLDLKAGDLVQYKRDYECGRFCPHHQRPKDSSHWNGILASRPRSPVL